MSIETAERLKSELTDKYVVVAKGVAELRRFAEKTGIVKTVNMNGRALVEFQGYEDIGWYDIDPSFLTVVPAPPPGKPAAAHAPAEKPAAEKKPVEKKPGMSPLELARQQGAAGSKPAAVKPAGEGATAGKKLSPLELARMQGAAKSGGTAPAAPKAEAPAAPPAAPAGKKLSPLELARQQGAFKSGGGAPAAKPASPKPAPEPVEEPASTTEATASEPAAPAAKSAGKPVKPEGTGAARTQSILELARRQGAFKG